MDEIKELLSEEIQDEIKNLSGLETGSEEKSKAINDLSKLHNLRIEELKIESENAFKEAERKDRIKERVIGVAVQVGLAIGGWIAYDIWHSRGLKFEETGTVTSPWTRNLMSKMAPKNK